jgi:hypothetical protein
MPASRNNSSAAPPGSPGASRSTVVAPAQGTKTSRSSRVEPTQGPPHEPRAPLAPHDFDQDGVHTAADVAVWLNSLRREPAPRPAAAPQPVRAIEPAKEAKR